MEMEEFIGQSAREQEDLARQFASYPDVATHIQFFFEEIKTANTQTVVETRGMGSSFILGDDRYGRLAHAYGIVNSGTNFRIRNATSHTVTGSWTLEGWATMPGGGGPTGVGHALLNEYDSFNVRDVLTLGILSSQYPFFRASTGTAKTISGTAVLKAGSSYHLAGVLGFGSMFLFVDGILAGSTPYAWTDQSPDEIAAGTSMENSETFSGAGIMETVRQSTVTRYTANFTPPQHLSVETGSTRLLWYFNEGGGTTAADSSTNKLNGIFTNPGSETWVNGSVIDAGFGYLGEAGVGAYITAVNQSPGSPFTDFGRTQLRDFLLGSTAAIAPLYISVGSGTAAWAAASGSLDGRTASVSASRYGEGAQLGSFQATIASQDRTGNGSYTEAGVGWSDGSVFCRDTFPLVWLPSSGSEMRLTMAFRVGS